MIRTESRADSKSERLPSPIDPPKPAPAPKPVRTGKDLILATQPYAKDQTLRSWWLLLSTAILMVAVLSSTIWIPSLAGRFLASILSGFLILRLFVIYHDTQHNTILEKSRLAQRLMAVFGIWAISPSSIWRSSHNHHHNHNSKLRGSQIGSFPILTATAFRESPHGEQRRYLASRHPLTLLFGYGSIFLYGMCLRPFLSRPKAHWDCALALLLHVGIAVALINASGWVTWLLFQTIPSLIACALGSYLFYVQHNFPGVVFREKSTWTYETAALESSSFLKLGPLMNWFTANIGYHHVHHLNPHIPFYRLPEAMRRIPELQNPRMVTLSLSDIARCLRLKVWDQELQCMTGVPH